VLAMADWQLGNKGGAREMLAQGDALVPRIVPASTVADMRDAWLAWLFARIQLDEAAALIETESPTGNNPANGN
jgi:hypothetical protein